MLLQLLILTLLNNASSMNLDLATVEKPLGIIIAISGDKIDVVNNKKKTRMRAENGTRLFADDEVETDSKSSARILMFDNSVLNVGTDSSVKITKQESFLEVLYGKLRCIVAKTLAPRQNQYTVKASTVLAGVRGTEFIVVYDPENEDVSVLNVRGTVNLNTADKKELNITEKSVVSINIDNKDNKSEITSTENLTEENLQKILEENKLDTKQNIPGEADNFKLDQEKKKPFDKFNDQKKKIDDPLLDYFDRVRTDRPPAVRFRLLHDPGIHRVGF
ncbi:MAG: FecR domain-containing protein [Oligoflexia bacterium]|nr:FecR domain-containing protein [Oligoflexia bacterium]